MVVSLRHCFGGSINFMLVVQRAMHGNPSRLIGSLVILITAADATMAALKVSRDWRSLKPFMLARTFVGADEKRDAGVIATFIRKMTGQRIDPQQTPWCAAFVNAVLKASGIEGTGRLDARSFLRFGAPADKPQVGDVAVFWRGSPDSGTGHVGFYTGKARKGGRECARVVGGNQDNWVSEKIYPADRPLGYRRRPPNLASGA